MSASDRTPGTSVHDRPAPAMIGKVVAILLKPRGREERRYVGRLAAYIEWDDQIIVYFDHVPQKVAEITVTQDQFSFQVFHTKE